MKPPIPQDRPAKSVQKETPKEFPAEKLPALYGQREDAVVMAAVSSLEKKRGSRKFFDLVDPQYQRAVEKLAEDSYEEKGAPRQFGREEWKERMALNWLVKREVFRMNGEVYGLEFLNRLDSNAKTPVIALTTSGSILRLSEPDELGIRDISYDRIEDREDKPGISRRGKGSVKGGMAVGQRCQTYFSTSPLIGILANPRRSEDMDDANESLAHSFVTVDHYTMTGGQKVDVLAPRKK